MLIGKVPDLVYFRKVNWQKNELLPFHSESLKVEIMISIIAPDRVFHLLIRRLCYVVFTHRLWLASNRRACNGTGKTLSFGIPILNKIIQHNHKNGRGSYLLALVLAPTRELAKQVDKEFQESAPSLDTLCCYGGLPIMRQINVLGKGLDIVVGTPGHIIDLRN
jgi:hypothetical protein